MLPANIGQAGDNALSIAASSNKGTLIRYLNDQVEDGFYTLVIDSLKDSNFDLSTMTVDDEVRAQCTKLYELAELSTRWEAWRSTEARSQDSDRTNIQPTERAGNE